MPCFVDSAYRSASVYGSADEGRTWSKVADNLPPIWSVEAHVVGVLAEVFDQAQRVGRRVGVGAEQQLRVDHVLDLDVVAVAAEEQVERVVSLLLAGRGDVVGVHVCGERAIVALRANGAIEQGVDGKGV